MIIRLQHQRSDGENDIYHLKSGRRYHIGRGSACEVRILDLKLSRKHCAIEYSEGEWRVIDLASTNGCKVNGDQIVGSVPLRVSSSIEIGQSRLQVVRILGEDEADESDLDDASSASAPEPASTLGSEPANAPSAAGQPTSRPPAHPLKTPAPLEQMKLDADPDERARKPSLLEHSATDWEPEPEPESITKTGALVPHPDDSAPAAVRDLSQARAAAQLVAEQARTSTGEIQRPGSLARTAPRSPATPPRPEMESGGYKTLDLPELEDRSPVSPKRAVDETVTAPPATPGPPPAPAHPEGRQPGTETRKRAKMVPVIVQPMAPEELTTPPAPPVEVPVGDATLPTFQPVRAAPSPPPPPPPRPSPVMAAPEVSASDQAKPAEAERTFFITVLGRRVGPLTRAAARDLKARELKGTLTFKDLDQYT